MKTLARFFSRSHAGAPAAAIADNVAELPSEAAPGPAPADIDVQDVTLAPIKLPRKLAVTEPLLLALKMSSDPEATLADRVLTRYEALRYWVPTFRHWRSHPQRAEAFFRNTVWPPLNPVEAGVLAGLACSTRNAVLAETKSSMRATAQRHDLAAAVAKGLLSMAAMQPYRALINRVAQREQSSPTKTGGDMRFRTAWAIYTDNAPRSADEEQYRHAFLEVSEYQTEGWPWRRVRATPEPKPWAQNIAENSDADTVGMQNLRGSIVSFVEYHNREQTGIELVQSLREMMLVTAQEPQLLAHLRFTDGPLPLQSNFLAGALVGTLYLGLCHGLTALYATRSARNTADVYARCKLISDRFHTALSGLHTVIDADHWNQLAFIVRSSIDASVDPREIRARIGAYIVGIEHALKRQPASDMRTFHLEQWRGVHSRFIRYPVVKLERVRKNIL